MSCEHKQMTPMPGNRLFCHCGYEKFLEHEEMDQWMKKNWHTMLSIVMLSVPERESEFRKLHTKVQVQAYKCHEYHPSLGRVEIVPVVTKLFSEGGLSIGLKRQAGIDFYTSRS